MRGLIGDLCIKTCLVNQNPAETCQVFGKNFSGQLYVGALVWMWVAIIQGFAETCQVLCYLSRQSGEAAPGACEL
jgi:hypothetical protein